MMKLSRPELRDTRAAQEQAARELVQMGKWSLSEKMMGGVFRDRALPTGGAGCYFAARRSPIDTPITSSTSAAAAAMAAHELAASPRAGRACTATMNSVPRSSTELRTGANAACHDPR